MSTSYSSSESEGSDNEAPEEFTLASSKKGIKLADKKLKDSELKSAQAKKAKNRAADIKSKAAKGKGKEKVIVVEEEEEEEKEGSSEEEEQDDDDAMDEEEDASDDEEEVEESTKTTPNQHTNYLDPALFASAAAFYEKESNAPGSIGKHDLKRKIRAEKQARAAIVKERSLLINQGGARDIGDRTIQHLPTPSQTQASLASTALPSHTSATKFLTNRLYSKKRAIAVLKTNQPREEPSGRKRVKKGGMSDESKILLGIPLTGGAKKSETGVEGEKNRKKTLLLQADGRRKAAANSRPLASRRARGGPAPNFAISSMKRVPERS